MAAPTLMAVHRDDLMRAGDLCIDEQTLDVPLSEFLPKDEQALWDEWEASGQQWEDCLALYGSVVCLGLPDPSCVISISNLADLHGLVAKQADVEEHTAPSPRGR